MALLDKLTIRSDNDRENDPEIELLFEQDPEPGETPATRARPQKAAAKAAGTPHRKGPGNTKLAREVAEDLASMLEATAAVWGLRDECCAPVLEQQAKPIADALVGILSRNPRLLAKFASTDIVSYTLQTVALGNALLPVGKAIYHNHVSKAVDDDQEGQSRDGAIHLNNFPAYVAPRPVAA